jgi:hypothetical protein
MNERIQEIQEKIKERENKTRRNRLISYSNQISKDLFEKDEDINRATQLMWNKDYEEAINEACYHNIDHYDNRQTRNDLCRNKNHTDNDRKYLKFSIE